MASLPTLETLKELLGIPVEDTSKDTAIQSTLDAAIEIIEEYCGRGLRYDTEREEFDPITSRDAVLFLYRFPVDEVTRVAADDADIAPGSYAIFKASGMLRWRSYRTFTHLCCANDQSITVEYSGGYPDDEMPASIVDAINGFFLFKWNAAGAGDVSNAQLGGAIKSAAVDGLSVSFGDAIGASNAALASAVIPQGLDAWAAQLERYRARRASGA